MSAAAVLERRQLSQRDLIDDLNHHVNRCDAVLRDGSFDGSFEERQIAAGQREIYTELLKAIELGYAIQTHDHAGLELTRPTEPTLQ